MSDFDYQIGVFAPPTLHNLLVPEYVRECLEPYQAFYTRWWWGGRFHNSLPNGRSRCPLFELLDIQYPPYVYAAPGLWMAAWDFFTLEDALKPNKQWKGIIRYLYARYTGHDLVLVHAQLSTNRRLE